MTRCLRTARIGRLLALRVLMACLALVGAQQAFVAAAFASVPRAVQPATWQQGTPWRVPATVDAARLPMRSSRRGVPTKSPSNVSRAASPEALTVIRPAGRAGEFLVPRSFVPPPPFHPPRAR